ncbi:MAG: ACP S-malonyltransferase [Epulopiscium sp.]|mgnify:CR=1 FL=1|nr:ACP S-malonyltransferase [Candidatus Epulonipiscium sp.]
MKKVAFLFPGQGAQYVGMGKDFLYHEKMQKIFTQATEVLGYDLLKLCQEGPKEQLDQTEYTQPALLTVCVGILEIVKEMGLVPHVVAGLSLGEYTALVCSGALDFQTAVALVQKRGKYMQEAVPAGKGTMAAIIGLEEEQIIELCQEVSSVGWVAPANFNCPGQIVVGGEVEGVLAFCEAAKAAGARRALPLSVSAPFHTAMLQPAAEKLKEVLQPISFGEISIPYITNTTGEYFAEIHKIKKNLAKQVMSPVLFDKSIRTMMEDGVDTFIEIGPGKVLTGFVKKIDRRLQVFSIEDPASLEKALESIGGTTC